MNMPSNTNDRSNETDKSSMEEQIAALREQVATLTSGMAERVELPLFDRTVGY